ncbi:hypothetical protein JXA40_04455 [bacterium]|nr:hypothetical protein [candidate division CSSED10-310 bacterium]
MLENNQKTSSGFKGKMRNFSDEVFRNYLIMRLRWKISALERQRASEIQDLGNRVFRLFKRKELKVPGAESLMRTIEDLEAKIEVQEEKLREVIIRADVPRQIPEKTAGESGKKDAPAAEGKPEPAVSEKKSAKPESGADTAVKVAIREIHKTAKPDAETNTKKKPDISRKPETGEKSGKKLDKPVDPDDK